MVLVVLEVEVLEADWRKSFSSNSIPMGTGQGKMFTTSPSGKINPQETIQQGPKQTASSSPTAAAAAAAIILKIILNRSLLLLNLHSNSNLALTFLEADLEAD